MQQCTSAPMPPCSSAPLLLCTSAPAHPVWSSAHFQRNKFSHPIIDGAAIRTPSITYSRDKQRVAGINEIPRGEIVASAAIYTQTCHFLGNFVIWGKLEKPHIDFCECSSPEFTDRWKFQKNGTSNLMNSRKFGHLPKEIRFVTVETLPIPDQ